ncbi:MAG: nuclear transport factor 2 family protein [Rhodocyclaceae bacterium]|nr:nuclear transport factor 2 family protein [Rhodocyclaceae bacterium]
MSQKPIFISPQEAENAFYDALERGDLDAMMEVWSEDEEILCIHPGGMRLSGYAMVREGWRRIFASGSRLLVERMALTAIPGPFVTVHSLIEQITLRGEKHLAAPVVATNIYQRGAYGWRMIVHHASPVPPDAVGDMPDVLH